MRDRAEKSTSRGRRLSVGRRPATRRSPARRGTPGSPRRLRKAPSQRRCRRLRAGTTPVRPSRSRRLHPRHPVRRHPRPQPLLLHPRRPRTHLGHRLPLRVRPGRRPGPLLPHPGHRRQCPGHRSRTRPATGLTSPGPPVALVVPMRLLVPTRSRPPVPRSSPPSTTLHRPRQAPTPLGPMRARPRRSRRSRPGSSRPPRPGPDSPTACLPCRR